jgi:hypothetical protein
MRKTVKPIWISEEVHKEFSAWAESEHRTAKAQFEMLWEETKKKLKRRKSATNEKTVKK